MKRMIEVVIFLIFIITMTGCTAKEKSNDVENQIENSIDSAEISELEVVDTEVEASGNGIIESADIETLKNTSSETDYISLSEKLSKQMLEGDFEDTYKTLSPIVKLQTKKKDLVTAWETTVSGLGEYIKIIEQKEEVSDDMILVHIILEYENNGLDIAFTYNKAGELIGLWFSYAPLEMKLEVNDEFEEILITMGEDTPYPISGILTLPSNVTKPPVAILVPGSGNHDQDETIGPNKPFRDIAHSFAKQGIATIRYRESILDYEDLKSEALTIQLDLFNDASKAITYATDCDSIDTNHIIVIGHSLGGMMAPKIAADHKEVSGIISMAGSPRKLENIVVDQQRFQLSLTEEYNAKQVETLMAYVQAQADEVKRSTKGDSKIIFGYPASYWYSLNQIDIPKLAESLKIPILISQGSEDWQVSVEYDYAEWLSLLAEKDNVTFRLYNNLNHLFMSVDGKEKDSKYTIKGEMDQQVIDDMAAWIQQIAD